MKYGLALTGGVVGGTILYGCPYLIPPAIGIGCLLAIKHNRTHHKGPAKRYLKPYKAKHKVPWLRMVVGVPALAAAVSMVGGIPFVMLGAELGFGLMLASLVVIMLTIGGAFDGLKGKAR